MNTQPPVTGLLTKAIGSIDKWAKAIPMILGWVYFSGYILTAIRLAYYHVPATRLLEAQYLAAGAIIGPLVAITAIVFIQAISYEPPRLARRRWPSWVRANVAFWALCLLGLAGFYFPMQLDNPPIIVLLLALLWMLLLAELGLWVLVVAVRKRLYVVEYFYRAPLKRVDATTRRVFRWATRTTVVVVQLLFVTLPLLILFIVGVLSFEAIPQAYGGGRPISVQLFGAPSTIPAELLDMNDLSPAPGPSQTVPLLLVFRSSADFIVALPDDPNHRAWVVSDDLVYASVTSIVPPQQANE